MKHKWVELAMRLAEAAALTSNDKYHKVGSATLRKNGSVCGVGYNGQPPGITLESQELYNRDYRRILTVHAESNALAYCRPEEPYLLATTLPPCDRCIVEAARYGVRIIICRPSRDDSHIPNFELCKRVGIDLRVIRLDTV